MRRRYLPFAQSGGQLLFHLISRLYEQTSIIVRGPISARHVTERLEAAAAHDVIWPGALYVLLDDIVTRGGRF